MPAEPLYDRVRTAIDDAATPMISTRVRVRTALAAVPCLTALAVAGAAAYAHDGRLLGLDSEPPSSSPIFVVSLLLVALTVVATFVAVRRTHSGMGSGVALLLGAAGLVTPLYAALTLIRPLHAEGADVAAAALSPWGSRCVALASIVGLAVLASFLTGLRRAVPAASEARGAALGAAAGAWAGLAVFAFCPAGAQLHILVGHVLPILALTLLGAFAAPRLLRP